MNPAQDNDKLVEWANRHRSEYSGFFPMKGASLGSNWSIPVPHAKPQVPPPAMSDLNRGMIVAVVGFFAIWILTRK